MMPRHALIALIIAACDPPVHATPPPPARAAAEDAGVRDGAPATKRDYASAIQARAWLDWPGLPAELREADLVRDLRLASISATRNKGRLGRLDATIVDRPGLRYWVRDGRVVLIQLTGQLGAASPGELQAQLGAADRKAAGRYLQSGATTTEYVFAGHGLALTVAESYDQPPRFAPRLAAVQLFAVTDLRGFLLELGGNDRGGPSR
jgi:hypothetical protein